MDAFIGLVFAGFLALGFGRFLYVVSGRRGLTGIFADLFLGFRADAWPRGVQEEDRDRPWGKPDPGAAKASGNHETPLRPTLVTVHSATRIR